MTAVDGPNILLCKKIFYIMKLRPQGVTHASATGRLPKQKPDAAKNKNLPAFPLAGVRVVDCTEFLSGPYCTMILSALGADVIKVERLQGDSNRRRRPRPDEEPMVFHMTQHNKRSLAIDLKRTEGREAMLAVLRGADIFVQNFRPGVVERLGLDLAAVRTVRPDIIYCSISGFGNAPPYGGMAGVDLVAQAMGGLMSVTGEPDGAPLRTGYLVGDMGTGMWAALGVLAAYARRLRTGAGDAVDVSMFDSMVAWSGSPMAEYLMTGVSPGRLGTSHQFMAPYECFECSDGRLVATCGGTDEHWPLLCKLLNMPELLTDPRFSTAYKRYENRVAIRELIGPVIKRQSSRTWFDSLRALGIPGGPVMSIADLAADEHVLKNQMLVTVDGFKKPIRIVGNPIRFADAALPETVRAPALGEHSLDVLAEAGLTTAKVRALETDRIILRTGPEQT